MIDWGRIAIVGLLSLSVGGGAVGCDGEARGHETGHEHAHEAEHAHEDEAEHAHEDEAEHAHEAEHEGDHESDHGGEIAFSKARQNRVEFEVGEVTRRGLRPSVPTQGIVRAASDGAARLRAPFAGRLLEPSGGLPDLGERVEAGAPLAVIAPTVDANALPMLRADLSKAKTALERRQREVDRLERLVEQGAVPRKRLLDARSERASAKADVEAAEERIDQYQSFDRGGRGAALTLRAPTGGEIVERGVASGEFVEPGEVLARIVDDRRLRLEVRIAEANLDRVDEIDGVWFEPSEGQTIALRRSEEHFFADLGPIDRRTRTSSAWFELPSSTARLRPGRRLRVHVWTGGEREVTAVPSTAILEHEGMSVVYLATGAETFERRLVETGVRDEGRVEITGGLEVGDRVVTRGAYYVRLAAATSGVGGHHH